MSKKFWRDSQCQGLNWSTHQCLSCHLNSSAPSTNSNLYRSIVGSLQFLALTRPDVAFSINRLTQYLQALTHDHLQAVKRVLRYLKSTIHYGILIKPTSSLSLKEFYDAD
ncbi:hypothetical protein L6164_033413 [Bauhinia variegata]|uniref:Uncharacterized protein n=1 Tax=Bauhinia variegata TaxID=167791 RepID=A0ACB9KRR9_BAUVA|nr:hypothetical protein L6164_033413 [Bauhinia variegata]